MWLFLKKLHFHFCQRELIRKTRTPTGNPISFCQPQPENNSNICSSPTYNTYYWKEIHMIDKNTNIKVCKSMNELTFLTCLMRLMIIMQTYVQPCTGQIILCLCLCVFSLSLSLSLSLSWLLWSPLFYEQILSKFSFVFDFFLVVVFVFIFVCAIIIMIIMITSVLWTTLHCPNSPERRIVRKGSLLPQPHLKVLNQIFYILII